MTMRVEEENPNFLEEKNMERIEFIAHLSNNICLGFSKYKRAVFKDTTAQIVDDGFTTDKIRRLVNGGDKFHPYL